MLFDLRVVLAACLATVFFAVVVFGLMAGVRSSPFKASAGYALNQGPVFSGPGLPKSQTLPLPVPEPLKPEVTGSITAAPQAGAKNETITTLIEKDAVAQEKPAAKAPPPKAAAKKRRPLAKQTPKQQFQQTNPFSAFINNNNKPATATP